MTRPSSGRRDWKRLELKLSSSNEESTVSLYDERFGRPLRCVGACGNSDAYFDISVYSDNKSVLIYRRDRISSRGT